MKAGAEMQIPHSQLLQRASLPVPGSSRFDGAVVTLMRSLGSQPNFVAIGEFLDSVGTAKLHVQV